MEDGWKVWKHLKLNLEIPTQPRNALGSQMSIKKNMQSPPSTGRGFSKGQAGQEREHSGRSRRTVGNPEKKTVLVIGIS